MKESEKAKAPEHPGQPQEHECKCVCLPLCVCPPTSTSTSTPPETCTFHIYLARVRVVRTSGDDPLGENEYTITGTANGVTVVHPSPTTWIQILKNQGWRTINRFITSVTLTKGSTKYVTCQASIIEWDKIANSSEIGESDMADMQLMCDQLIAPVRVNVELHHLTNIPTIMGEAEVEFRAYQI